MQLRVIANWSWVWSLKVGAVGSQLLLQGPTMRRNLKSYLQKSNPCIVHIPRFLKGNNDSEPRYLTLLRAIDITCYPNFTL